MKLHDSHEVNSLVTLPSSAGGRLKDTFSRTSVKGSRINCSSHSFFVFYFFHCFTQ